MRKVALAVALVYAVVIAAAARWLQAIEEAQQ